MKNFSLYDILGVLAPGSIMVVGIVALFPGVLGLVSHGEFTGGELGLVVLLSYAVGNLVAALGNLLEPPYRWLKHRMPVRAVRATCSTPVNCRGLRPSSRSWRCWRAAGRPLRWASRNGGGSAGRFTPFLPRVR